MAAASAPNLSQQLSQLIQTQLAALKNNPKVPGYDFSNLNSNVIDPTDFAKNSANAEYDPRIAALNKQIGDLNGQAPINQQDITDWYKQAQNTYNAGAANADKQYGNALSQLGDSSSGFMSALGGSANPANPGIAQQALIQEGMLQGNHQADVNLNTNMAGLIPLAAAQAHGNQKAIDARQLSDLMAQLTAQKSAKGAAYNTAFQDATNTKFGQLNTIDNANFGAANQNFNNIMTRRQGNTQTAGTIMNALITSMLAPGQLTAQNLSNQQAKANIKATNAKTNLAQNPALNINKPGDVQGLQGNLAKLVLSNVIDPNTGSSKLALTGDPKQAWRAVQGQLQNYKIANPQWNKVAQNWFKTYLPKGWAFSPKGQLLSPADIKKIHTATYPDATAPSGTNNNPYNTTSNNGPSKPTVVPNKWDSSSDPIVGSGPTGTGLHKTRSGRYVNSAGFYAKP